MNNHLDYCTHIQFQEDRDILTRTNFDVNIRLLKCNKSYKTLIDNCVQYIIHCAQNEKIGYKAPHGWSGANAGIPFRIIALKDGRYFINPFVTAAKELDEVMSNCGSLTLPNKVKVSRYRKIDLQWFDLNGKEQRMFNIGPIPGYTIQHEINHTLGKLIVAI